ncbi:MAG: hypothetical protein J3Q66DRAFT_323859 [Benniella sp.]|nr:MAG: hypothetical protein J3Q66DRAFT_323859 [Benniella sp.]
MDATLQSSVDLEQATAAGDEPSVTLRPSNKAKRNYRNKRSDEDDIEDDPGVDGEQQQAPDKGFTVDSSSPYVQSQNAQNLGEVYPGLARLSFMDQEKGLVEDGDEGGDGGEDAASLGTKKPRRPLQQRLQSQGSSGPGGESSSGETMDVESVVQSETMTETRIPPMTSPSALSSASGPGSNLVEIRETGSVIKGRGVFSTAIEILKPGTLVFKELGYCRVVNDASLSNVCSACFKDVRDEIGEDEASGSVPVGGQRKLVRCAGCKVVWYCNKTCQIKDWKVHHQLECQGIQKSMANTATKDVWTKRTVDTTTVRALCRLIRRRERVKASKAFKAEHGKLDAAQKQVNEVYFSGLDQKEEEWLDEHGATWIEQYLNANIQDPELAGSTLKETGQLTKTLAIVMSCVNTPKEDRHAFLKGSDESTLNDEGSPRTSGLHLLRKLESYAFEITNLETTTAVGLALYAQCMPFMNHSCVPNCVYTFKGSRVECRVIRDIQPGEELTISYIDQIGTTVERQRQLKAQYHFTCECPLCKYFPANPLIQPEIEPLVQLFSEPLPGPLLDPKQGFVCPKCRSSTGGPILATESQLAIYNKVELRCNACGHTSELTQERFQESEENAQRLVSTFVREMNGGSAPSSGSKAKARNFELAKAKTPETVDQISKKDPDSTGPAVVGGMKTVQEPTALATESFNSAYKALTGTIPSTNNQDIVDSVEEDPVCRGPLHRLVRQLEQAAFDEAVSHKNWVFALKRSIELERILSQTYVGHHPVKAIQGYYTCKIANLLANLLLEESTIEIEESDQEKEDEDEDPAMLDSDDERDLKSIRDAMRKGGRSAAAAAAAAGSESIQERVMNRKKRKETEEGSAKGEMQRKKRTQIESSKELLQYLKSLIPRIENSKTLQDFKVCWGKDSKLASRYRSQIDSMKQALHYAEQPFAK